jgi:serine protease Do
MDSTVPRIGSLVIAVGHPFGVRGAVTVGIIHAIGPLVRGGRPWVQADLRLAPGNSGGPIADAAGRVVGVNTMVVSELGLAVPIAEVQRFVRAAGIAG